MFCSSRDRVPAPLQSSERPSHPSLVAIPQQAVVSLELSPAGGSNPKWLDMPALAQWPSIIAQGTKLLCLGSTHSNPHLLELCSPLVAVQVCPQARVSEGNI